MLSDFQNGKHLSLDEYDAQHWKMFKLAANLNLIYEVQNIKYSFSQLIVENIENRFIHHDKVLADLETRIFNLIEGSERMNTFFEHNKLVNRNGENVVNIYFNHSINEAANGSFCVLEMDGTFSFFIKKENVPLQTIKEMIISSKGNRGYLGKAIAPMGLFRFITSCLYDDNFNKEAMTIIFQDGSVQNVSLDRLESQTFDYYERTALSIESKENLVYIQNLESILNHKVEFVKGMNAVNSARDHQLLVSQYKIDFADQFSYLSVDTTYVDAALHALTHSLAAYLTAKEDGNSVWISDRNKQHFYIRGMASFLEKDEQLFLLEDVPAEAELLIDYLQNYFEGVQIALKLVVGKEVGRVYILDSAKRELYSSELTLSWEKEIIRGLSRVICDQANEVERRSEKFHHIQGQLSLKQLSKQSVQQTQQQAIKQLGERKITEKPWIYQPLFEEHGLFIGKFIEDR